MFQAFRSSEGRLIFFPNGARRTGRLAPRDSQDEALVRQRRRNLIRQWAATLTIVFALSVIVADIYEFLSSIQTTLTLPLTLDGYYKAFIGTRKWVDHMFERSPELSAMLPRSTVIGAIAFIALMALVLLLRRASLKEIASWPEHPPALPTTEDERLEFQAQSAKGVRANLIVALVCLPLGVSVVTANLFGAPEIIREVFGGQLVFGIAAVGISIACLVHATMLRRKPPERTYCAATPSDPDQFTEVGLATRPTRIAAWIQAPLRLLPLLIFLSDLLLTQFLDPR